MAIKTLYTMRKIVWLTLLNHDAENSNMPYGNADFVFYKGSHNKMEFVIRDVDRKPVHLQGKTLRVNIINFYNEELVYQNNLKIDDPYKGKASILLEPTDTASWSQGFYKYSILIINEDGTQNLLFNDQAQNAKSFIDFKDDVLPKVKEAKTLRPSDFMPKNIANKLSTGYVSGAFAGPGQKNFSSSVSSFIAYTENFTGKVKIQATLEEQVSQNDEIWFDLEIAPNAVEYKFDGSEHGHLFSIDGRYQWFRIIYEPDIANKGKITKFLINI